MSWRRVLRGCGRTTVSVARLKGDERRLYLAAWWTLLTCRLRLRFPGLLRGRQLVRSALLRRGAGRRSPLSTRKLADLFHRARADQLVACPCLPRSVALVRFLGSNGVPAELALGLRREEVGLAGHAWVMQDGRPVNDSPSFVGRYVRLLRAEPYEAGGARRDELAGEPWQD
jgi:hypothetical protein